MAGNQPHFASASLYVGDLDPDVNETMLFEVFNAIGPVASIRVCRESGTRKSLGYAYVNYHSITDAERALDTLNYTLIKGVPCRIMWSHRDPSLRRSGAGNIFVKNLDKMIDNKALYDTFSLFGNILSCKVATDEYGKSKGYGFVHYETEESGRTAIEKVNNMQLGSKTVYVGPFKRRVERLDTRGATFTNLYVKQFPSEWTEDVLRNIFSPFGEITSLVVSTDNLSRRFAFVNYKESDAAKAAIAALHGKRTTSTGVVQSDDGAEDTKPTSAESSPDNSTEEAAQNKNQSEEGTSKLDTKDEAPSAEAGSESKLGASEKTTDEPSSTEKLVAALTAKPSAGAADIQGPDGSKVRKTSSIATENRLYVQRAMSKAERMNLLKESFSSNNETKQKQSGVNLYVKNLDDQVTDDALREAFAKFGTVTSAKVMRDEMGVSKGFGFVCFAFPDEATSAVTAMHLNVFQGKPLYVGLAEKRDHRIARLQQRYRMSNMSNTRPPNHHGSAGPTNVPTIMMGQPGAGVLPPQMLPYHPAASPATASMYYNAGASPAMTQQGPPQGASRGAMGPSYPGGHPHIAAWRHHDVVGARHPYAGPMVGGAMGTTTAPPPPPPAAAASYPSYPLGPTLQASGPLLPNANAGMMGQNFKFTPQARNRQGVPHMHLQSTPPMSGGPQQHMVPAGPSTPADMTSLLTSPDVPLSAQTLATAHPQLQKQILGEKLFPLVHKHQPELAGKITGMMLEMDNAELLSLLDSEIQLQAKVDEALGVLHRHHQGVAPASSLSTTPAQGAPQQQGVPPVLANAQLTASPVTTGPGIPQ